MYADHFGLTEAPFSIAPNPQYLFMSSRHRDALAHLLYGVQCDGGFILLTGEVGTGKTTLCRCLLEQVPTDVDTAFVLNPRLTERELLATVCDEFGIDYPENAPVKTLVDQINLFLLKRHAGGRKAVLIIDEAQNLSRDLLEQLRLLTNLETNQRKLLQIILLGQPELLETLDKPDLRQLSQRIIARFHLEALTRPETEDYIAHRLSIAGGAGRILTRSALRRVYTISGGVPRVINLICDRALLGAWVDDRTEVTAAIVNRAAGEVLGRGKGHHANQGRVAALAAMLLLGLGLATFMLNRQDGAAPGQAAIQAETQAATQMGTRAEATPLPPVRGHRNITEAYHDLFALWGSAFEDRSSPPCDLAAAIGLQCLSERLSPADIQTMNRPVIVQLDLPGSGARFLTLSKLDGDAMILFAGSEEVRLNREQFKALYDGRAHLVGRMPPDYHHRNGDTGAVSTPTLTGGDQG